MTQTRSILYDKDGNPTEDESAAVRGEVVELDAEAHVSCAHLSEPRRRVIRGD
jgi:hypothetical protein